MVLEHLLLLYLQELEVEFTQKQQMLVPILSVKLFKDLMKILLIILVPLLIMWGIMLVISQEWEQIYSDH